VNALRGERAGARAPAAKITVSVRSTRWPALVPAVRARCRRAAAGALAAAGADAAGDLAIVLADDATLRALNHAYRGKDEPTNVLAFPMADAAPPAATEAMLGDVVIAAETVAAEAQAQGKPVADHLAHLVVHGVLHLLGHTHDGRADARRMEALETRVLAALGVPDPYVPLPRKRRAGGRRS